jgi:predicted transcriptional regulator
MDILACILYRSIGGARKTNLIYKCNLSLSQFKSYSGFLIEQGLMIKRVVKAGSSYRIFETTDKGKRFIEEYRKLLDILSY